MAYIVFGTKETPDHAASEISIAKRKRVGMWVRVLLMPQLNLVSEWERRKVSTQGSSLGVWCRVHSPNLHTASAL